jgi:hypothetical protein|tara:strand:+ start:1269 stop:2861 length:1593 start_codon:yes stop_codon:yes gene_type:complete
MKKKYISSNYLYWDTRESFPYYPDKLKKIYKKIYIKNYKKYSLWIDEISKANINNINWWLSVPASRDERISKLFHNICIFLTLKSFKNKKYKIKMIINSNELKKIILKKINITNVEIKLVTKNSYFKKLLIFLKEILLLFTNLCLIKIKFKEKKLKYLNIVDIFKIEKHKGHSFYGDFLNNINFRKNLKLVPTFLSYSPLKIYRLPKNNKNIYFKENIINFKDIALIIKNFFSNYIILKNNNFLGINYNSLIKEEITVDENFRSILNAYLNYYFFKNLRAKKIKLKNVVSWFENQIVDKGWSIGVNNFYPHINFIGYQGATLHPQFFNLSPTKNEFKAKILPKKIYLVGKKYLKNRKLFTKKPVYKITKFSRFDFSIKNKKKKYFLFLLSGIKHCDDHLLNIYKNFIKKYNKKNVFIKFHPILSSNNFEGVYKNEIRGNGSKIIQNSKFVITTSYTSGLYESMANNAYTVLIDYVVLDSLLYKDLRKFSKYIFFCKNSNEISKIIKNLSFKNRQDLSKKNNKVKKMFFNK